MQHERVRAVRLVRLAHCYPREVATRASTTCALLSTLPLVLGCERTEPVDAGSDAAAQDAGDDAGRACASSAECENDLFCDGVEVCVDAVCHAATPACRTEDCDEAMDRCVCGIDPDVDGDGHESIACGGNDCDDDDPNRYGGNSEACDLAGEDEDCDPSTVGDLDADGDGFVSSECCNGTTCGPDCEDRFRGINPDEMELCNALDDNCDGRVDEPIAFCPTGMCVASRCVSVGWERVIDSTAREDQALGLAVDRLGNVHFGVSVDGPADIDGDSTLESPGVYIVSVSAEGRVRWLVSVAADSYGVSTAEGGNLIAVHSGQTITFLNVDDGSTARTVEVRPFDDWTSLSIWRTLAVGDDFIVISRVCVGEGAAVCSLRSGIHLIRFASDGSEIGRRLIGDSEALIMPLASSSGRSRTHFAIAASAATPIDLGTGTTLRDPIVVFNRDLSTARGFDAAGSAISGVDVDHGGSLVVAGSFSGSWASPWTSTTHESLGSSDGFASLFDGTGAHQWTRIHSGPNADGFGSVAFDGRASIFVSGVFSGEMDVTPRGRVGSPTGTSQVFLLYVGESDGDRFVADVRLLAGNGTILQAFSDPFGALVASGSLSGPFTLPSGATYDTGGRGTSVFVFRLPDF